MRRMLSVLLVALALSVGSPVVAQGEITNPSFENETGWSFYASGSYWMGEYTYDWASHGSRSYQIHIPPAPSGCENYPGTNTYGEVYQDVDLTGVEEIAFDLKTYGPWDIPALGPGYYHSAEVWLDGTKVYSREREVGEFFSQMVPTKGVAGIHTLSFRMQGHDDFCSTADRGLLVDNVRFVRHKVYLPLVLQSP